MMPDKIILHCLFFFLLLHYSCSYSQKSDESPSTGEQLYNSLNETHKVALDEFDHQSRTDWTYLPGSRRGIPLEDMDETTKKLVEKLLDEFLSEQGYKKTWNIIELEDILRQIEGRPVDDSYRDQGKYYFKMYGNPSTSSPWGYSFEGHHLSLNFTVVNDKVTATPAFHGANPATVPSGKRKGWQVLKNEEELARQLVKSLDKEQQAQAIFSSRAPRDIITGTQRAIHITKMEGISYSALNENQQNLFKTLLSTYIDNLEKEYAALQWQKIENWGFESLYFAWAGGLEPGRQHYYKIMGPTLLIEYDNIQNNANHIHTVWRDSESDFGRDLLKEHYQSSPHHQHDE